MSTISIPLDNGGNPLGFPVFTFLPIVLVSSQIHSKAFVNYSMAITLLLEFPVCIICNVIHVRR